MKKKKTHHVVIIGGGPAGIGLAWILQFYGGIDSVILERDEVGASFDRWTAGTRLLTPSFTSNAFGAVDLNAITPTTSPAFSLRTEHPLGAEYAEYLNLVVDEYELDVRTGHEVVEISSNADGFDLTTTEGASFHARFVVWAGGEYSFPNSASIAGIENAVHVSQIPSWDDLPGTSHVVIGGYESGLDAALSLSALGKKITVIDQKSPWRGRESDPSLVLSPWTIDRMQRNGMAGIELVGDTKVAGIQSETRGLSVMTTDGSRWECDGPPVIATGYRPLPQWMMPHFEMRDDGYPVVNDVDESTQTPGLFLSGPVLRHENIIFCFIYKFRQRFGVVAREITHRLGEDISHFELLEGSGFLLDDLSCCDQTCAC